MFLDFTFSRTVMYVLALLGSRRMLLVISRVQGFGCRSNKIALLSSDLVLPLRGSIADICADIL